MGLSVQRGAGESQSGSTLGCAGGTGCEVSRPTLYIICANPSCRAVKAVRSPYEQRTRQYCSRRCVAIMTSTLNREAQRRGGIAAAISKRRRRLASLAHLSPIAVFRLGFQTGWKRGRACRREVMEGTQR